LKGRFYGKLADVFGSEREIAVAAPTTVAEVRQRLAMDHPEAAETLRDKRVRACIGDVFVLDDNVVPEDELLEFLAPVSGG
jgi:molybdopterin converting factor small subunit